MSGRGAAPTLLVMSALALARRGFAVFPVHSPRTGGACSCGSSTCQLNRRAKHPRTEHGYKNATHDPRQIVSWWETWPDANVGIAVGPASRVWVLDEDPRSRGDEQLAALEHAQGPLPPTLSSRTGGGGRHFFFGFPEEPFYGWKAKVTTGLDVKAEKGYVVAPPSLHISGASYEWLDERACLLSAPSWLLALATKPRPMAPSIASPADADETTIRRARAYVAKCAPAISGSGGHIATLLVAEHLVRGFNLDDATALAIMSEWNETCQPPWSEHELRRKITEARTRGTKVKASSHLEEKSYSKSAAFPPPHDDDDAPVWLRGRR